MNITNHNFYVKKILKPKALDSLYSLYNSKAPEYAHQDYSLFNVEKSHLSSVDRKGNEGLLSLDSYMFKHYKLMPHSHYFLKYVPYSWTRQHTDNIGTVTKTVITCLDVKDLVGGETLVWDKHFDLPTPKGSYVKRTGSVHRKSEIICSPRFEAGDSLVYDYSTQHAVSQVQEGHRVVLVSWFVRK